MLYHRIEGLEAARQMLAGSDTDALARLDGRPALIHLPSGHPGGAEDLPHRIVSTLLHGNEDSGFKALCRWIAGVPALARPLWIFIGNTRAATQRGWYADRYLDDQEDFNRVWGITPDTTRMRLCATQVLDEVSATPLEAALDLHNNTGDNPLYAILPRVDPGTRALAAALADTAIVWGTQEHTLMQALGPHCPAVAVECGMAGVEANVAVAQTVLETFVTAPSLAPPAAGLPGGDVQRVLEVVARVEVRREVSFDFTETLDDRHDLALTPGLDGANFGRLHAGTVLGRAVPGSAMPFVVRGTDGEEIDGLVEVRDDGAVALRRDVIPAMMTRSAEQTRRDCLFYVLEPYEESGQMGLEIG